jgi:ABC-2 type transport system ATP-binding protein
VDPGEVLGLVGPNGAGKTTTIRSIAGIIIPTAGCVRIAGHDLSREPVVAKSALAFIPDEPHLFDYLTVEEHLRFIGRLYRVADAGARIPALLDELDLADKRRALPGELSRGMKQKLAIACGLLHEPRALLLDEPLTGLDPVAIRRMKATITSRAAGGAAVILSSHLLHLVEEICTRVLVMQRGRTVAFGTIPEIVAGNPQLQSQSLEDVFLALIDQAEIAER